MSDLVDPTEIESIVGVSRHHRAHYARAVSDEQCVYILHSKNCVEDHPDLRECEFSLALDSGINIDEWEEDKATLVQVIGGKLLPARVGDW